MKKMTSLFAASLLLVGCGNSNQEVTKRQDVKVKVMDVMTGARYSSESYSGTVEEENGTALSFAVAGTVKSVHFSLGQKVTKGQLLATLDAQQMQHNHASAKATLTQAEDAYKRMKELHDHGSLPEIQWVEVQSKLEQARSMERIARKQLEDCTLRAPFSGIISAKMGEVGQNVMPGSPIGNLITGNILKVKISVPETEIANIHIGQKAMVRVSALEGRTLMGKIVEKGAVANALSRTYDVKIRLDEHAGGLLPGMVSDVCLEGNVVAEANTEIEIPAYVVQLSEDNSYFVWTVKENKAKRTPVVVSTFTADGVVVTSGLKPGDRIITEGQQKVCENTVVSIMK